MATIGEIAVNLVARTTGFDSGLKQASASISTFAASAGRAAGTLASMVGIAGGFGGLGFAAKLAADAEQATVAINTMTGSLSVTKQLIADINQFSTVTPFEPTELRQAAQALLAYNYSASEIMPTLKTLGDISAGTGRRLIEFVNIVGKVRDRGKLTAETLNEFRIRAASIMEPLAKVLGVTRDEVVKLASAGKISFKDLEKALGMLTTNGGLYFDAMAKQSETLAGRWSTLTGNVKLLGENLGTVLIPVLATTVNLGNRLLEFLLRFNPNALRAGVSLAAAAAAMVLIGKTIPIIVSSFRTWNQVLNATIARQITLAALAGPAGWGKLAIAIGVTIAATYAFNHVLGDTASEASKVADSMKGVAEQTKAASDSLVKFTTLRQRTLTASQRAAELERRAVAAGFAPSQPSSVRITSRSLMPSTGATTSVVDEVRRSNDLLAKIETNTREGGVEINEVSL